LCHGRFAAVTLDPLQPRQTAFRGPEDLVFSLSRPLRPSEGEAIRGDRDVDPSARFFEALP